VAAGLLQDPLRELKRSPRLLAPTRGLLLRGRGGEGKVREVRAGKGRRDGKEAEREN